MAGGRKNCVFFVAGGDPGYAALLDLCVSSIRRFHSPAALDVVVMCDARFADAITGKVIVIETAPVAGPALYTSMLKVRLPECLRKYDKVLFLDCDIVVCSSLDPLFRTIAEDGVLYTCQEGGPSHHRHLFWSLLAHTREELEEMERRNVGVFNCGQFGFVPGDETFRHFANVRKLMSTHEGPFFVEQSHMNHYFAHHPEATKPTLTPFVKLAARSYEPNVTIAHFSDASMSWQRKLELMRAWHASAMERTRIDPFALLGVSTDSTSQDVRRRYYELSTLVHPDRGGSADQMHALHVAYSFVKDQVSLNRTATYEDLMRDYQSFCEAQTAEPPPFADIFAEAHDLPTFAQLAANSDVAVDGAFAEGDGYAVVASEETTEYVPSTGGETVMPFDARIVEYVEPEGSTVPAMDFCRHLAGGPSEPFSCRVRDVHTCDYRDALSPAPEPPAPVASSADVVIAFDLIRAKRGFT